MTSVLQAFAEGFIDALKLARSVALLPVVTLVLLAFTLYGYARRQPIDLKAVLAAARHPA